MYVGECLDVDQNLLAAELFFVDYYRRLSRLADSQSLFVNVALSVHFLIPLTYSRPSSLFSLPSFLFFSLSMEPIMDNGVQTLSGGELQRCAIVLCLGTAADIYLVRTIPFLSFSSLSL